MLRYGSAVSFIQAAILCWQEDPRKTGEQSSLFMQESSLDGPPVCNKTAMFYYVSKYILPPK